MKKSFSKCRTKVKAFQPIASHQSSPKVAAWAFVECANAFAGLWAAWRLARTIPERASRSVFQSATSLQAPTRKAAPSACPPSEASQKQPRKAFNREDRKTCAKHAKKIPMAFFAFVACPRNARFTGDAFADANAKVASDLCSFLRGGRRTHSKGGGS